MLSVIWFIDCVIGYFIAYIIIGNVRYTIITCIEKYLYVKRKLTRLL